MSLKILEIFTNKRYVMEVAVSIDSWKSFVG